ncbi:ion transporter [Thalassotalea sp. LPB0316]|uniref:ion transporter n=1 Tax=Thalassotalea sp. LPB0316 TaxID=2769490 RepID=UPI0018695379|nr:ion transporter [Thalassotalea sp. LPB0316]QOL25225.1 ion transporter [Thalassotalea sp. LPB0316]
MSEKQSIKQKAYELLETGFEGSLANKLLSGFIVLLILSNVIAVVIESYGPIGQKYQKEFYYFNVVSVAIFTLEYFARIWVCTQSPALDESKPIRSRLKYLVSPVAIIDLLAIAPFYLSFIFPIDLRYLRMLRMLRLLKLTHYFRGLNLFIDVLKKELPTIGAAVFIMAVLVILSGSIMYGVEHSAQPKVFDSIPSAIWWSVVTMTTVGYGDVTPITFLGKFIAMFIMLLGVGVVALPAAMLAAKFGEELSLRKRQLERKVESAVKDGGVSKSDRVYLNNLAAELNISQDVVNKLIKSFDVEQAVTSHCPHCKKPINSDSPTNE